MSNMRNQKRPTPTHPTQRRDSGDAFLPDPASGTFFTVDDAESAAEEFIASVTSASSVFEDSRNELSVDEMGGPFLVDDDEPLDLPD